MSTVAGYQAKAYINSATTAMTGEACSAIADDAGGRKRYQITNAAHRRLDPAVAIVVKANAVVVPAVSLYFIDNFGIITFAVGIVPIAPVTVDGNWLSVVQIPGGFDAKFTRKNDLADNTNYGQTDAQKRRVVTLTDGSMALKARGYLTDIYDGGSATWEATVAAGTPVFVEFDPDGAGVFVCRGWGILSMTAQNVTMAQLAAMDFTVEGAPQVNSTNYLRSGFGWGVP